MYAAVIIHGIIDLLLIYDDKAVIVDYKLKNTYDDKRFLLYMNDGNEVYITISRVDLLNKYIAIVKKLNYTLTLGSFNSQLYTLNSKPLALALRLSLQISPNYLEVSLKRHIFAKNCVV